MKISILLTLILALLVSGVAHARTIKVIMDDQPPGQTWTDYGWDDLSGPDPYIEVDGISYRSQKCKNKHTCVFEIPAGRGPLTIHVKEADLTGYDDAGSAICYTGNSCRTKGAWVYVLD